jgi:hypothetical protein
MNSTSRTDMELTDLNIRALQGEKYYTMQKVRITSNVPKLDKSLPNTIDTDVHVSFKAIICPLVTRDQCDLLIGADNAHLIEMVDEPDSRIVDGDLFATRTRLGWVIRGCEPENTRAPAATAIKNDIETTTNKHRLMPGVCGILQQSRQKKQERSPGRQRSLQPNPLYARRTTRDKTGR